MISDVIHVNSDGTGIREALRETEKVAQYKQLSKKDTLHLRLLAEEMMGMLEAINGVLDAEFRIENEGGRYKLHLRAETLMNSKKRAQLLSASTSGTNSAAKGVMGKIRELFERALEPVDNDLNTYYSTGWYSTGVDTVGPEPVIAGIWSLNKYKDSVDRNDSEEAWDELEKSIVANLADEVEIGIKGGTVEMTIFKEIA
jgi:hypothetical protein